MRKIFSLILTITSVVALAQNIEKNWSFSSIENADKQELIKVFKNDYFNIKNGQFSYFLEGKDSLHATGNYILQNNLLIFNEITLHF